MAVPAATATGAAIPATTTFCSTTTSSTSICSNPRTTTSTSTTSTTTTSASPSTNIFQEPPPPPPPTIVVPQKKTSAESRLEFDLHPPPPAMFLPEEKDKIKIAQLLAQRRNRRPKQPANRQLVQQQLQAQRNLLDREQQAQRAAAVVVTPAPTLAQPVVEQPRPVPPPPTAFVPEPQSSLAQLSHLEPKSNDPNKVFLSCCKHKRVDKVCESRCNFDTLNKKVLTQMFIGTDPCPQNFGLDLFSCAAQDSDHTPCCMTKKVERTSAGKKCLAFCKMTPDSHFQATLVTCLVGQYSTTSKLVSKKLF
uniref:Domain of unknown function DB domain-containing protein n=1 Tax=Ditylenchus dipsaci TaxID=166011 RepID=A0A915EK11_9BILA